MRKIVFVLFILIPLSGCGTKELFLDIPISEDEYFIEAYFNDRSKLEFALMKGLSISDSLIFEPAWNAVGYVEDIMGTRFELENIAYKRSDNNHFINYVASGKVFRGNGPFNLYLTTSDGVVITAESPSVSSVIIEKEFLKNSYLVLDVALVDSLEYYILDLNLYESGKAVFSKRENILLYDKLKHGGYRLRSKYPQGQAFDSLTYTFSKVPKETFEYQESVKDALEGNRNPSAYPVTIKSNVEGAHGIFSFYSSVQGVLCPLEQLILLNVP